MPLLVTDDGPRRLRGVWLGPKGLRWPMDWTYTQWGVFFGLMVLSPPVVFAVFYPMNVYLAVCNAVLWSPFLAYYLTRRVMAHTDYDRPLRFWLRQVRGEFQRSRRTPSAARLRVHAGGIAVGGFALVVDHHYLARMPCRKGSGVDAHATTGWPWPPDRG